MSPQLLEAIGRALYENSFHFDDNDIPTWDELSEETWLKRSTWIKRAEKVVETYKKWIEDNTDLRVVAIRVNKTGEE
jgi:hypothetical protein